MDVTDEQKYGRTNHAPGKIMADGAHPVSRNAAWHVRGTWQTELTSTTRHRIIRTGIRTLNPVQVIG
jgi:hypothetical protein